jgi:hypothetical protein
MTDAPVPPALTDQPTTDTQQPTAGDQNNSPLAVLDQILNEAKQKTAESAEAEAAAAQEQQRQAEEAQRQLDAQKIAEEQALIASMKNSPQAQARAAQDQVDQAEKDQQTQAMDGMEIRQLTHTKL